MVKIKVLLIEDNSGDAYLVKDRLQNVEDLNFDITYVQYLERALELLEQQLFDVILLDLMLPDSRGLDTFEKIARQAPDIAIIIISAMTERELAIQAVKQGAQDYLSKDEIPTKALSKTIQYGIERKSITQQLTKRTAELEYLNQELQAFSYTVSHDLKNPLNIIKGMSSLLLSKKRSQPLDERDRLCIERIHQNSLRMEQITRNLLNLSKVERSQMSVENVDLSELVRDVVRQLQLQQPDRQVNLAISPKVTVLGDIQLLRLILENLLGNAWKYTQNHSTPTIEFGYKEDDSATIYYIKDNGIGFDAETAKLFEPFQRLDNSKEFEGTGIGLATVKRIIERHQGKVWFEASLGEGACFFFTLGVAS